MCPRTVHTEHGRGTRWRSWTQRPLEGRQAGLEWDPAQAADHQNRSPTRTQTLRGSLHEAQDTRRGHRCTHVTKDRSGRELLPEEEGIRVSGVTRALNQSPAVPTSKSLHLMGLIQWPWKKPVLGNEEQAHTSPKCQGQEKQRRAEEVLWDSSDSGGHAGLTRALDCGNTAPKGSIGQLATTE